MNIRYVFTYGNVKKWAIICGIAISLIYISWWFRLSHVGNPMMYGILVAGELYYLFMTYGYWLTVWDVRVVEKDNPTYFPKVDFFVPVCGEPIEIIEQTIQSILAIKYKNCLVQDVIGRVQIYILNDGFVAKKDNWEDVVALEARYPVKVITRQQPGGAKAGNINHALTLTHGTLIAIFDADMKPYPEFLQKTCAYFRDRLVAFVQSPQYYENYKSSYVASGAWAQQELFFGPICQGKNKYNATFCCGTNVIIRRKALEEVGGFDTANIAEDFSTSVNIHNAGWKSIYYPQVLASGLAPLDFGAYFSQQLRWAKGSIDVFFQNNPLMKNGLTWQQKLQYFLSLSFYFMGIFVLLDALIPVIYLFTGSVPVHGSSSVYILLFLPYIFLTMHVLSESTAGRLRFKALQFSIGSFYIHIIAFLSALTRRNIQFAVTGKTQRAGRSYFYLVWPHLMYLLLGCLAIGISMLHQGLTPAVMTNTAWIAFNIAMFSGHMYAALPTLQRVHVSIFIRLPHIFHQYPFLYDDQIDIVIPK